MSLHISNNLSKAKIYHGPTNIGGIGGYLAVHQRKNGLISEFITYNDKTMRQNHDKDLKLGQCNSMKRIFIKILFFLKSLFKYKIFHFYFGETFFPKGLDLPILKLFRKKTVMTYCGSEVRLVNDVEKNRNPYYKLLKGMNDPKFDEPKKKMLRWQNLWIDKFIVVRGNYYHINGIIPTSKIMHNPWVHNAIDLDTYTPTYETKEIPTLVHAPSNPEIKGSKYVENAIEQLKEEGYKFEYIRLEKKTNDEAQQIYREKSDIIIDQFLLGDFGQLAIEGMYFGKPVCAYIGDDILEEYPDCPIVNCTIDNLKEKLAWLITNPTERIEIGKSGHNFVRKYCDRKINYPKVIELYEEILK